MPGEPQPPTLASSGTVDPGAGSDALKEGMKAVRDHLRRTGTALGAIATAVLGGLGYARLHELFPVPAGDGWLIPAAAVAGLLGALGAAVLAGRFFAAQRRVLLTSEAEGWNEAEFKDHGFTDDEHEFVTDVLGDHAREEDAASVRAVELRGMRLERAARGLPAEDARRARLQAEAARLHGVVRIALMRGAATVLEHRADTAFRGRGTKLALVSAVVGILGLFALADYADGQRDLVDLRAKCAKAEKEGARDVCEPVLEPLSAGEREAAEREAREAKAKADAALAKAEQLAGAERSALVDRARACDALVAARLEDAPEAVRVAATTACLRR